MYIYNDQKVLQKYCFLFEDQNVKNEAHSFYKNGIMDASLGNTLLLVLPYGAIVSMDQPRLQYGVGNASGPCQSTYLGSLQSNPLDFSGFLCSHPHPILLLPPLLLAFEKIYKTL